MVDALSRRVGGLSDYKEGQPVEPGVPSVHSHPILYLEEEGFGKCLKPSSHFLMHEIGMCASQLLVTVEKYLR